jgi:hypothetical protein
VAERGPQQQLASLFAAIDPDNIGDLDGAHDEANMPAEAEPAQVMDDLNRIRAVRRTS